MYQAFQIVTCTTSFAKKNIILEANGFIDFSRENEFKISILEKATKNKIAFKIEGDGKNIILSLFDYPIANSEYILSIDKLYDVTGNNISHNYLKRIQFENSILSHVKIISPEFHERCEKLNIEIEEYFDDDNKNYINSYYCEIAKDNNFFDIVKTINFKTSNINIEQIALGQYFLRARVQKDDQFSNWSEVISFEIDNENEKYDIFESDDPVLILEEFEATKLPIQNVTPDKFVFEFNYALDDTDIKDNISINVEKNYSNSSCDFDVKIYDNILEIIPKEKIEDNSLFQINFNKITATNCETFNNFSYKLFTKMSPMYSDLQSVQSLIADCEIDEYIIMFNIREASKYANFLGKKIDKNNISFEISQFTKFKAAHDCLLKFIISKTSTSGTKGKIGEAEFQDSSKFADLNKLLEYLKKQIDEWKNEICKEDIKFATPVAAIKSKDSKYPNTSYYRGV